MLLSYYIEKFTIPEWKDKFTSAGQKVIMYKFKGTNGRYLTSFESKFKEFITVEGKPRNEWPTYDNGQQLHKQYTVSMIETKLFYKEDGIYHKTAKGNVYEKYLNLNFKEEERWLVNYLMLLDSTIANRENYLINRSLEVQNLISKNISDCFINNASIEFLENRNKIKNYEDLAKYDYLYFNCFFLDPDFLRLYISASIQDREELKEYVKNNLKNRSTNCCISKKFISTNYSIPEIIDDAKIYCFSIMINSIKYTDFDNTIKEILGLYKKYYSFDENLIIDFINKNRNIFEPILINVFNIEDIEDTEEEDEMEAAKSEYDSADPTNIDVPEPRIDDTTIEGKHMLKNVFAFRKKIAREKSNYRCELEQYKCCRYFTSKTTKHNYVEVHHFVPREFRNNYENSIDVLANYITLCPHCHKMIHLATDRERIDIIRYIYNQRKKRLEACGIDVELQEMLEYYNIEEN